MTPYPYIHLRVQSSYSLAEGSIKIKRIVELAKKNNMPSIALTDNNNLFGALEFSLECVKNGIQPIIGSSLNLLDVQENHNSSQINLLVKNKEGYKNLLYLSSISHTKQNNIVGIRIEDLINHTNGLICFIGGQLNPLFMLKLPFGIKTLLLKNSKKLKFNVVSIILSTFISSLFFVKIGYSNVFEIILSIPTIW